MKRNSESILEQVGNVVFAHKKLPCNVVKGKGVFKIGLNVGEDILKKSKLLTSRLLVVILVNYPVNGKNEVAEAKMPYGTASVPVSCYFF